MVSTNVVPSTPHTVNTCNHETASANGGITEAPPSLIPSTSIIRRPTCSPTTVPSPIPATTIARYSMATTKNTCTREKPRVRRIANSSARCCAVRYE